MKGAPSKAETTVRQDAPSSEDATRPTLSSDNTSSPLGAMAMPVGLP